MPARANVSVHPATAFSHWDDRPEHRRAGEGHLRRAVSAGSTSNSRRRRSRPRPARRSTTLPFLTEASRAELRALNIYTVEALAAIDGQELKNLGHGGRDMKNKAARVHRGEQERNAPQPPDSQAELEALQGPQRSCSRRISQR